MGSGSRGPQTVRKMEVPGLPRESKASRRVRAAEACKRIVERYPGEGGYLRADTPFQLVIAVLLSAQTTDRAVNNATPELFSRWPGPEEMASADVSEIEHVIRSIGFHKTKARRCVDCARTLLEEFDGEVPQNLDDLQRLPGVGRKTANVVLNDAFGIADGIAVDTHVGRIARRMGFSKENDPSKVEQDLLATIPKEMWSDVNRSWIALGREICGARNPKCEECFLGDICPSYGKTVSAQGRGERRRRAK